MDNRVSVFQAGAWRPAAEAMLEMIMPAHDPIAPLAPGRASAALSGSR